MDAPPPPAYNAPASDPVVPLARLRDRGEARFLGPGGTPRLVRVARGKGAGPGIVFIHGFTGDPANQEVMLDEARARGMAAWVMAYDTVGATVAANSTGFTAELAALAAAGNRNLTIVAHSLGAVTLKAALDLLDARPQGFPFRRLRVVAISTPWRGLGVASGVLRAAGRGTLPLAADLATAGPTLRALQVRPWPAGVTFEDVAGSHDPVRRLAGPGNTVLPWGGRRSVVVAGACHNTVLWAPRTLDIVFGEARKRLKPQPPPPAWQILVDETAAVLGLSGAFAPGSRSDRALSP